MNDGDNNSVQSVSNDENDSKKISKSKKRIIIIIASVVLIIALLATAVEIIEVVNAKKRNEEFVIDYDFYPANYDEDIFLDERYLELIHGEYIRLCDSATNVTVGIDTERVGDYSPEVQFMLGYIDDIIHGNHESYNSRFSDLYYENKEPLSSFTMQKVYDVLITQLPTETATDEKSGVNYTKHTMVLEYKIFENNGTFRKDIGKGSKKQYITVTDRTGALLIDSVSTVIVKQKK